MTAAMRRRRMFGNEVRPDVRGDVEVFGQRVAHRPLRVRARGPAARRPAARRRVRRRSWDATVPLRLARRSRVKSARRPGASSVVDSGSGSTRVSATVVMKFVSAVPAGQHVDVEVPGDSRAGRPPEVHPDVHAVRPVRRLAPPRSPCWVMRMSAAASSAVSASSSPSWRIGRHHQVAGRVRVRVQHDEHVRSPRATTCASSSSGRGEPAEHAVRRRRRLGRWRPSST